MGRTDACHETSPATMHTRGFYALTDYLTCERTRKREDLYGDYLTETCFAIMGNWKDQSMAKQLVVIRMVVKMRPIGHGWREQHLGTYRPSSSELKQGRIAGNHTNSTAMGSFLNPISTLLFVYQCLNGISPYIPVYSSS